MDVSRWLDDPGSQQIFRLFGYAGTGKTTLARHLASNVHGQVLFAAYTGKAASVLKASGCPNAQTIHSLIYSPKEKSRARLRELEEEAARLEAMDNISALNRDHLERLRGEIRAEKENAKRPDFNLNLESNLRNAALLVVDECSMVGEDMAQDILSFGVPVLVLGDPAQLPPVKGTGFFTDASPDMMLTEIHRQARDNPIIAMATKVRLGDHLDYGSYGSSSVIERATPEIALEANQVLVGKNKTRTLTNRRVRQLLQYDGSPWPVKGEKLICLRNAKLSTSQGDISLLNGTIHHAVLDAVAEEDYLELKVRPEDGGDHIDLTAHKQHFDGNPESIDYWERRNHMEFTFGHAITVHKSQGSQWGDVMLIDEWFMRDTRQRWLYTAITRAQEKVTVVRAR